MSFRPLERGLDQRVSRLRLPVGRAGCFSAAHQAARLPEFAALEQDPDKQEQHQAVRKMQHLRLVEDPATESFGFVPIAEMDERGGELTEDDRLPATVAAQTRQGEGLLEDRLGLAESAVLDGETGEVELRAQRR